MPGFLNQGFSLVYSVLLIFMVVLSIVALLEGLGVHIISSKTDRPPKGKHRCVLCKLIFPCRNKTGHKTEVIGFDRKYQGFLEFSEPHVVKKSYCCADQEGRPTCSWKCYSKLHNLQPGRKIAASKPRPLPAH